MLQPLITVGLPTYNSAIAWLAMESLCRQQTSVPWELIIAEDKLMANGYHYFRQYEERLQAAGCVRFRYSKIPEQSNRFMRMPLSRKWKNIAQQSSSTSIGLILQASDCYSEPQRIQTTYDKLVEGYDWIHSRFGIFSNLANLQTMLFDFNSGKYFTGLNMAINMNIAIRLPDEEKWKGVDFWMYNHGTKIKPGMKIYLDESENWRNGVDTDGYNKISMKRSGFYNNIRPPFVETDLKLNQCIPGDVMEMVNNFLRR